MESFSNCLRGILGRRAVIEEHKYRRFDPETQAVHPVQLVSFRRQGLFYFDPERQIVHVAPEVADRLSDLLQRNALPSELITPALQALEKIETDR